MSLRYLLMSELRASKPRVPTVATVARRESGIGRACFWNVDVDVDVDVNAKLGVARVSSAAHRDLATCIEHSIFNIQASSLRCDSGKQKRLIAPNIARG